MQVKTFKLTQNRIPSKEELAKEMRITRIKLRILAFCMVVFSIITILYLVAALLKNLL